MLRASALILLCLASCGKPQSVDPDFQVYVDRWNTLHMSKVDSTLLYADIGGVVAAFCSQGENVVTVDRAYFSKASDLLREEIIFHELGHCVLHLNHDSALIKDPVSGESMPRSIMYPFVFGNSPAYKDNLSYYHEELGSHG